ncbi:MAG: NUDIX domain-containing protein, partial [Dongiaceae bacterium]
MTNQDFQLIEKSTPFQGYFRIDLYRFRHRLFAGGWSGEVRREVFERGHAVVVLPYDPERDAVVMIEQFRIGAAAAGMPMWQLEMIAGIIDEGETPEAVARREAREEARCEILDLV